jgi:glucose/arabinose dehydrogenase
VTRDHDFWIPENHAQGRPVGVAIDNHGALLVGDDVGNVVWRVSRARKERQAEAR